MRKFRFVGDSSCYAWNKKPVFGRVYSLKEINKQTGFDVNLSAVCLLSGDGWEEVFEPTEKPIDKVTVKLLDLSLRICGIQIHEYTIDKIIDVFELLEEKGGKSTIEDFEDLKAQWKKQ